MCSWRAYVISEIPTGEQIKSVYYYKCMYIRATGSPILVIHCFVCNVSAIQFLFPIYKDVSFSGPRTYGARDRRLPNEAGCCQSYADRIFEIWNFIIQYYIITIIISCVPRNVFERVDSFLTFFFSFFHWLARVDRTLSLFFLGDSYSIRYRINTSYNHIHTILFIIPS